MNRYKLLLLKHLTENSTFFMDTKIICGLLNNETTN